MNAAQDDRPVMGLGHLAIPNVSASQDWLKRQGEKREKSVEIVAEVAKEWWGSDYAHMPDFFWEALAERVVTELDHRA
jgi:hypothetical protein